MGSSGGGRSLGVMLVLGGALAGYLLFQKFYVDLTGRLPGDVPTAVAAIVIGFVGATLLRRNRDGE